MKNLLLALCLVGMSSPAAQAVLILADNFNAPDNTNFDNSDQTGRRSGTLGPDVQLRSSRIQQQIIGNQLQLNKPASGSGRIRFHDTANLGVWHDFATGPSGAAILADGGFRVQFDWTPVVNNNENWVSYSVGIAGQGVAEPGTRVNHADTDFGILFRQSGGSQFFDNSVPTTGGTFTATTSARHVVIDYLFSSFADGANFTVTASVDGSAPVVNQTFQWAGNAGALYMELGSLENGTLIDNFSISTIPEPSALAFAGLAAAGGVLRRRRR
ncbi:MAG: PEP-CTERM sorting domain-containing protein [Verrucomicrobiota bacterium]